MASRELGLAIAAGDPGWQHTARASLSAWRRHHLVLKAIFTRDDYSTAVAFSPDGKTLLTGGSGEAARFWNAATGKRIGSTPAHVGSTYAAAFSPDGKVVVTGGDDKLARIWDAASGESIAAPLVHTDLVLAVAFSPDGKSIFTGSADKSARLWNSATGQPIGHPWRTRTGSSR